MVKNDLPVKTGAAPHPGAFFADTYMCLVYKISTNAVPVEEGNAPVRDVFKVLTMGDLEVTDTKSLEKLDPKFFRGSDSKPRLGVNVGAASRSVKVFNLNGLSIILDPKNDASKDFKIKLRTIVDGTVASFDAKDYFEMGDIPAPGPNSDKKKSSLTIIIIICIVVVVIVLGVVGFIVSQKPSQSAEDVGIDDVEKTMKQPDDTNASGAYTKL